MTQITQEAPVTNPHQPIEDGPWLRCSADECHFALLTQANFTIRDGYWAEHFRREHSSQYDPGRAPDISVEWELVAHCSVCPDGIGKVEMCEDGDAVCCAECGTHWSMTGTGGEREEAEEELPAPSGDAFDAAAAGVYAMTAFSRQRKDDDE